MLAAVTPLGGCGFRPLYGSDGVTAGVSDKLAGVSIGNIPDRQGQQLRNLLIDRFHRADGPATASYTLDVSLKAVREKLALRKDAAAERAQLNVEAAYRLTEPATGRVVFRGSSRSFVPYSIVEEQYASLVNVEAAFDQAAIQIADDITMRVATFLARGS